MTRIVLTRRGGRLIRIAASGHSGYAPAGEDIVCAAVTACFRLVDAQLGAAGADYRTEQNDGAVELAIECGQGGGIFEGFAALMHELCAEYPENISITEVEQNA